jgi:hypothetical protein
MRFFAFVVGVLTAITTPAIADPLVWSSFDSLDTWSDLPVVEESPLDREGFGLDLYVGMQKLSGGGDAYAGELCLRTGRFRLFGEVTRFEGVRMNEPFPTVSHLSFGLRLDDGGPTHVLIEAGIAHASIGAGPVVDADPIGVIGGVRVERVLAHRISAFADVASLRFVDDVHATSFRAGVRLGPIQAAFRAIDFNIGPALYGPELGVRF